jgi:hypothetical protein
MLSDIRTGIAAASRYAASAANQRFGAARRIADDEIAAAVVAHHAGRRDLRRHVDHRRYHRVRDVGAHALEVVDAVLQAEHHGVGREMRCDCLCGGGAVGRLDAKQHQVGTGDARRIGRRRDRVPPAERAALQHEAVTHDRLHQRGPANQPHARAGARQHGAEIAADRTGAHHGDVLEGRRVRHCIHPQP